MYESNSTANLVNLGKGSVAIALSVGGQTAEVSKRYGNSLPVLNAWCPSMHTALYMHNTEFLLVLIAEVFLQHQDRVQTAVK